MLQFYILLKIMLNKLNLNLKIKCFILNLLVFIEFFHFTEFQYYTHLIFEVLFQFRSTNVASSGLVYTLWIWCCTELHDFWQNQSTVCHFRSSKSRFHSLYWLNMHTATREKTLNYCFITAMWRLCYGDTQRSLGNLLRRYLQTTYGWRYPTLHYGR